MHSVVGVRFKRAGKIYYLIRMILRLRRINM